MAKLFKFLFILIVILAVLLGGVAFYLLKVFDPNDYKVEIQQLVKQHTQLDLTIGGDLSMSVFPWLGVGVKDIAVKSGEDEFASVREAQVYAEFKPLLEGKLVVDGVKLDALKLNLVRDKNGKGNWEFGAADTPTKVTTDNQPNQQVTPGGTSLAALSVGSIDIDNADISYTDQSNNSQQQISGLNLLVSNPQLNQSFPFSADFKYLNPAVGEPIPAHLTSNIKLDLEKQQLQLNELTIDFGKARLTGQITADHIQGDPLITSQLSISELYPSQWAKPLGLADLANMNIPISLEIASSLDTSKDQLTLKKLNAKSDLLELSSNLTLNKLSTNPIAKGKLSLKSSDLKKLLSLAGSDIETQDVKALSSLSAEFDLNATPQSLDIKNLLVALDDTKIKGWLGIKNFDKPSLSYNLAGDSINLDRYTPPQENEEASEETPKAAPNQAAGALLLPIALLKELNTKGQLNLDKVIASGLTIENLDFKTNAKNGLINLEHLKGDIYEGKFNASAKVDARGNTAQLSLNGKLQNMQAAPVLKALAEVDYVSGMLNLNMNASAIGNSLEHIKNSLNGKADFSVTQGVLQEINIEDMVCQGIAQIRQMQFTASEQKDTQFKKFDGRMTISKGIAKVEAVDIGLDKLKANGTGTISLPKETLDFSLKTTLLGDLENKSCEVHQRYRDIDWPIRCQGTFDDDPSDLCGLDSRAMQKIIGRLAEQELKRKGGEKLEELIKKNFGDDVGDQLKQIFKF